MPAESALSDHSVSIAFVRSALSQLDDCQRSDVLAAAQIDALLLNEPSARVPAAAFAQLWMAVARALDDEFFGLDSRRMKVGTFAMLCHALLGQATVGAAMQLALRGFGLCFDDIAASLRLGAGGATLQIDNRIAAGRDDADARDARRFADETLLVMLHGLLCWLAGRRVPLTRLDWGHAMPDHADEYRRMFAPLLHFDAAATAVQFDARVLAAPLRLSEPSVKAFLRDAPQSVFLKQVKGQGLADRVRRLCRAAIDRGDAAPTLQALADGLALSAATLRRRLDAEGSRWQWLKDEVRRDLALQLLAEGELAVGEIAARLGFDDASTFYRAFRKWTGQAPGAWRAQARSPALAGSAVARQ